MSRAPDTDLADALVLLMEIEAGFGDPDLRNMTWRRLSWGATA